MSIIVQVDGWYCCGELGKVDVVERRGCLCRGGSAGSKSQQAATFKNGWFTVKFPSFWAGLMARAVNDLSRDAFFYLRHRSFASDIWTDCRIRSAGLKS
jgi:hypothetical protein